MARRRVPERPPTASDELPETLAMGPCVEVWGGEEVPPPYLSAANESTWVAFRARHAWARAVDQWATETGWAGDARPVSNARNLARTRHPWSREFLLNRGEVEYVDWLEGRRETNPGRSHHGWATKGAPM